MEAVGLTVGRSEARHGEHLHLLVGVGEPAHHRREVRQVLLLDSLLATPLSSQVKHVLGKVGQVKI